MHEFTCISCFYFLRVFNELDHNLANRIARASRFAIANRSAELAINKINEKKKYKLTKKLLYLIFSL